MEKSSRYSVKLFHKAKFVVEQYDYALRSCYQRWPFQELPKPKDLPHKNDSCLIEVFKWESKFLEVFCDYEDLFPEYSREDFYWRLIWEGKEKREALFNRIEDIKEQFWSLIRTVAIAEDKAEAGGRGIEPLVPDKEFHQVKDICKILNITPSYFTKLKATIEDFPEPSNKGIPRQYSKKETHKITTLITNYRDTHSRKPPTHQKTKAKHRRK